MSSLTVSLNRDGLNTVETDQTAVRATESVDIVLENHGKPTHVHLHLDDDLATLGTIEDPQWFVPKGEWREVELQLMPAAEGRGRLEIAAGYGKEKSAVDVEVEPVVDDADTGGDAVDTVGVSTRDQSAPEASDSVTRLPEGIDTNRLRNPVVLATLSGFLVLLLLLFLVDPLAGIIAGVAALLGVIAVGTYVADWDPLEVETEDS